MSDFTGIQTRFVSAVRRNYQAVDHDMPRRIAGQLITGKHIETFGFESARTVVMRNAERVTNTVVIRPSAKLVKHQKANCATVNAQTKVRNAVNGFIAKADELHTLRNTVEALEQAFLQATSAKQRRNIKSALYNLKRDL